MLYVSKKSLSFCVLMLSFFAVGCKELDAASRQLGFSSSQQATLPTQLKQKMLGKYSYSRFKGSATVKAVASNPNALHVEISAASGNGGCGFESICVYQSNGIFLCPHGAANDPRTIEMAKTDAFSRKILKAPPLQIHPTSTGFLMKGHDFFSCGAGGVMEGNYIKR